MSHVVKVETWPCTTWAPTMQPVPVLGRVELSRIWFKVAVASESITPNAVDRRTALAAEDSRTGVGHRRSSQTSEGGVFSKSSEVLSSSQGQGRIQY